MLERANDPQEAQSADEDLPGLPSPFRLAEEVGEGLGAGSVLLRSVQETAGDTTMMRPVVCLLLSIVFALPAFAEAPPKIDPLGPGDHTRTVLMGEQKRTYLVHVPKEYDPKKPAPVVLALHGAAMDGSMMVWFSGLNKKSDEAGFIVVYPSGMGVGSFRTWNAGGFSGKMAEGKADDVAFIGKLLDDLNVAVKVDEKRIYACGMSNGGMMCYRLAAELSDRIAAIAPVAGTIAIEECKPNRPVPVIHFHGSKDNIVPFEMTKEKMPPFMKLKGVEESVQIWVKLNGCDQTPTTDTLSKEGDETKVTRTCYGGGKDGSEVVLVVIEEGGHTWPGQKPPVGFIGKSAMNMSANDLMWVFFEKHKLK
jgi:polyhydroxybutyrate depolymerase